LAFIDSLNPFSIAACAIVIAGQQSLARGVIFVGATFAAYFIGGLALVSGWEETLKLLAPYIRPWMAASAWSVLCLVSLVGAIILWRRPKFDPHKKAKQPGVAALIGVFVFALSSTLSDLPTALPYFGAIPIMVASGADMLGLVAWLGFLQFDLCEPADRAGLFPAIGPPSLCAFDAQNQWVHGLVHSTPDTGLAGNFGGMGRV
jgi:hypothetical protein